MRGIRVFQVSIHLPGVAPGTAPSRNGPAGGAATVAGSGTAFARDFYTRFYHRTPTDAQIAFVLEGRG